MHRGGFMSDACVINHDVDPAVLFLSCRQSLLPGFPLHDVTKEEGQSLRITFCLCDPFCFVQVNEKDLAPFLVKAVDDGRAEAVRAT